MRIGLLWICTIWLLSLFAIAPAALASELVRRIQEELRKRHVYYGDVDGRHTTELGTAIEHYQERKGLAKSGKADSQTLSSLGIERADLADSEGWPEAPVLRSDAADEIPPQERQPDTTPPGDLPPDEQETPKPMRPAPTASGPPASAIVPLPGSARQDTPPPETPQISPPPAPAPQPTARPNLPPIAERVEAEAGKAEQFVRTYLEAAEKNDFSELNFYAPKVDYFTNGVVNRSYLEKDVAHYYKRWPERKYTLLDIKVLPAPGENSVIPVRFRIRFEVKNGTQTATGQTDDVFKIRSDGAEMKFMYLREWRVRRS